MEDEGVEEIARVREDGAMEGGAREDGAVVEDGALEGGERENGAVGEDGAVGGRIREDGAVGDEAVEDALREHRAVEHGAREGEQVREDDARAFPRQPLQWTLSWKSILGISIVGVVGIGILVYVLIKQRKKMKALEAALEETNKVLLTAAHKEKESVGKAVNVQEIRSGLTQAAENFNTAIKRLENLEAAVRNLESGLKGHSRKIAKLEDNIRSIPALQDRLNSIQFFVVDMAKRQKWPWPFNNRLKGLEETLELPKK